MLDRTKLLQYNHIYLLKIKNINKNIDGGKKVKRTFQPKKRQNSKEHGFFKRMKTRAGRNVLKARRAKGRKKLTA